MGRAMKRGEVRWYRFARSDKNRPVVILTRDAALEFLEEVTIAPIISAIRDIPTEVLLTKEDGMSRDCAVNLDHIQAISKVKIGSTVINNHTIKPMDEQSIIRAAKTAGCVVTVEDHQVAGGMGSAVAEILAKNFPVPMEMVGVSDSFGESGRPAELYKKYGLTKEDIISACKRVIRRSRA